jgi:hypothetical protein
LTIGLPTTFIGKRADILERYLFSISRGKGMSGGDEGGFWKLLS